MPYINREKRTIVEGSGATNAGELNYLLTKVAIDYVRNNGLNYARINDVVGALEGAKLEFYRRVAASYEDQKIAENGDVYGDILQ